MNKTVFVLMPFTAELDRVFQKLIVPPLVENGFDVRRADTLDHQQNILRDIVAGIAGAGLVIADLTGNNANVMYELGIAHALDKRVIMLTQSLESVPFDLRAYRIIKYSTSFDLAEDLSVELKSITGKLLEGQVSFGNPVSDFNGVNLSSASENTPVRVIASDERTLVDLLLQTENAGNGFVEAIEAIEPVLEELARNIHTHLEESARRRLVGSGGGSSVAEMITVGKLMAQEFDSATSKLASVPSDIQASVDDIEDLSLAMFSGDFIEFTLSSGNLDTAKSTFNRLGEASANGALLIGTVMEQIHPLRKVSQDLNRALKLNMSWWNELKNQFERVTSITNRVIEIIESHEAQLAAK